MIQRLRSDAEDDSASTDPWDAPVRRAWVPERVHVAFVDLATTGPDPRRDELEQLELFSTDDTGAWSRDLVGPDGVDAALERLPPDLDVVLVPRGAAARAWLGASPGRTPWIGVDELARLLAPATPGAEAGDTRGVLELRTRLTDLARRFLARADETLSALAGAWSQAHAALVHSAPDAARRLAVVAGLLDGPQRWTDPGAEPLPTGRIRTLLASIGDVELEAAGLDPGWVRRDATWLADVSSLPPQREGAQPLDADERRRIAACLGTESETLHRRPGQLAVAEEVGATLGSGALSLVHAPTGTGKTLGYLLPVLAFAKKNELRVGVSTYTRALQRQAFERDVPLALGLLEDAGYTELPRVALLKGRTNYLCWRGLVAACPRPADDAGRWLAWAHLLAFALDSPDGDLDQLPRHDVGAALALDHLDDAVEAAARGAAGRPGCCTRAEDRRTCGADSARRRAERSHVVVTNHSFVLARREFLRHVVFDECEHLHDQAHNAYSHVVPLARLTDELEGLGRPGRERARRTPLERLARAAGPGSDVERFVEATFAARGRAVAACRRLTDEVERFCLWREESLAERVERDSHAALREYAGREEASALLDAHRELCGAVRAITLGLGALAELLEDAAVEQRGRLRFRLDRTRTELEERLAGLTAWLPTDTDPAGTRTVRFAPETFYDVEQHPRRGLLLAARVLLPDEYLGRFFFPELADAVVLSATTWLRGGFESSTRYLGLDRACAPPATDEEDPLELGPRELRTMRAEEAFDYRRVLVAIPRDTPSVRDKPRWLAHLVRLVGHVAERTRGRCLVLLTNAEDCAHAGRELEAMLEPRGIACLWQGRPGFSTERLAARFREPGPAVLLGLDSFWFGADFPGDALEVLVIARLPYGVPDRYHHAQCAVIGADQQRRRIYMPRALARFRQGFGRLMRRRDDRGVVLVLDGRVLEPRHRIFLRELPLAEGDEQGARLVRGDTDRCLREAFAHLELDEDLARRGLRAELER